MTWTYSGNPSSSSLDAVRFRIGDTDTEDQLVTDEEIAYLLTEWGNVPSASIAACEAIAAKFSRLADRQIGNLRISASQKSEQYRQLAATLRRQQAMLVIPYAGGISRDDKLTREDDSDRVVPAFSRDMMTNPANASPLRPNWTEEVA